MFMNKTIESNLIFSTPSKLKERNEMVTSDDSKSMEDVTPFREGFDVPIETLFTENLLGELKEIFQEGPMALERFIETLKEHLGLDPEYASYMVPNLFNAVDTYRRGFISFSDLCQYLYEDYQLRDMWMGELDKINLLVPGRVILPKLHRPPPVKLIELDDLHLLFSKDGMVSYWSNSFKLRKCRSLKTREIEKERHYGKVYCDIVAIESIGKIIVSTSDKEMQFYDLQSLEPFCQIHSLPSSACSIHAKMSSQNMLIIAFGDWHGAVNVIGMANAMQVLRNWSERPKIMGIAATTFDTAVKRKEVNFARWKVHERRVDKVIFTEVLGGQVITCSTDPNAALCVGCAFPPFSEQVNFQSSGVMLPRRPIGEEHTYKIAFGIQTIDIWEEKRFLAASGVDRTIRVWNIMTKGDPICTLHGHNAPVRHIQFFPPVLVSITSQKNIRIWELKEFRCIINLNNVLSKMKGQEVFFMHCSKLCNAVVVQTSEDLYALQFQKKVFDDESGATHSGPVVCGQFNDLLNVWITCSNSQVKLWDVKTGKKKSEFKVSVSSDDLLDGKVNAELKFQTNKTITSRRIGKDGISWHRRNFTPKKSKYYPDFNEPGDVTCMYVAKMGNRLLTGHANGVIQEFNFVSGMNIRTMCKPKSTKEGIFNSVVNGVIYVKSALNDNVLSVGWDKVVDVYLGGDSKSTEPITSWNCYKGHEDDIMCVTSVEPNLLATGSFEGLVILWNFTSGKIEGRLLPPCFDPISAEHDMSKVTALSLYKKKIDSDDGTEVIYLFSAGPNSGMHMWEIYWKMKAFYYRGRIRPWESNVKFFCSLASAPQREIMLAADNLGKIYIFDMKLVEPMKGLKYNQRGFEFNQHLKQLIRLELPEVPLLMRGVTTAAMPELKNMWQAHSKGIPVLSVSEAHSLILTGDAEGKARIWNFCGDYIGMLGQYKKWDIYSPNTYLHLNPQDFRKSSFCKYDDDLGNKCTEAKRESETLNVATARFIDNLEDYKMENEEINIKAKAMAIYKKVLPDFLRFENCYKVVYRNCLRQEKYSLTPIFKRSFDNELLEGLPKHDC